MAGSSEAYDAECAVKYVYIYVYIRICTFIRGQINVSETDQRRYASRPSSGCTFRCTANIYRTQEEEETRKDEEELHKASVKLLLVCRAKVPQPFRLAKLMAKVGESLAKPGTFIIFSRSSGVMQRKGSCFH